MKTGWIKLHNKFLKWEWRQKPEMVALFIHFLLNANYKENKWQGIIIGRGQLVTGLKSLSKNTGLSPRTLITCITSLKSTGEITNKSTNKYRIITIVNWEQYQGMEEKTTSISTGKTTIHRQTTDNQTTSPKEYKEDKNIKKEIAANAADSLMTLKDFFTWCNKSPQRHIRLIGEYADTIRPGFTTRGQWESFMKRNLRPAKDLSPYTDEQIEKAIVAIQKAMGEGWLKKYTLETLIKFLT
jgi:hypothetical protein